MTDLVQKVGAAFSRFHPNGGDDWGWVQDIWGPERPDDPETAEDVGSFDMAHDIALQQNIQGAIAAVYDDLEGTRGKAFFDATAGLTMSETKGVDHYMSKFLAAKRREVLGDA